MRFIVTQLLTSGIPHATRGMPHFMDVRTSVDPGGRPTVQLWWAESSVGSIANGFHLIHPQLGEIDERSMTWHGYQRQHNGQLVAQAWRLEFARR